MCIRDSADLVQAPPLRHWVIGDVHGCHASLLALLTVLPCQDHLVFCGDVVSRCGRIEASMHLVWDLVCCGRATWLRGNHEQALIDALTECGEGSQPALNRQWAHRLNQLPLLHCADGWCATHAGFNSAGEPDLSIREPFWETYDGRHGRVVIGHTPRPAVERHQRIVLIDTGAVYGGLLSAYCPETDAVVQVQGPRSQEPFPRPVDLERVPAVMSGDQTRC